jgi:UDP-3-O-[3-hydroxymyristoyl] glucosamine N-acyltransferase
MPRIPAAEIARFLSSELNGPDLDVSGAAPLAEAAAGQVTFATDPVAYRAAIGGALERGAVVLVPTGSEAIDPSAGSLIGVGNARSAFAQVLAEFFVTPVAPGVDATAVIHPTAVVDPTAHVGPYSVVGEGVRIGARTEIRAHVVIGRDVQIGADCLLKSHAVVGEEGFGMEKDAAGDNIRIPHIGGVRLGSHVEVGNFTTVCAGTLAPTTVGDHTKIDDHVHIAHNCRVGRNVIITAAAEISGSVVIEDDSWIGPNASVIQGMTLGEHSLLGIGAVAVRSVPANEVQIGNPARRFRDNPR